MPETVPAAISRDEVAHLAHLARIDIDPQELDHYADQLREILAAVAQVSEVAAQDVPATSHPLPLRNVFRDDVPARSLDAAEALSGAPAVEDGRFRVPRILDAE
jgi:aspartyl-tRNA(Asn)/glutamyl-tRNA(Gln) amidotransferase subunit C